MKATDTADKYLSYYSVLMKMVKWPNAPTTLCTLQYMFVYKTYTNKNFLQEAARSKISEDQNPNESSSDELLCPEK
jgi:hypothetical protein